VRWRECAGRVGRARRVGDCGEGWCAEVADGRAYSRLTATNLRSAFVSYCFACETIASVCFTYYLRQRLNYFTSFDDTCPGRHNAGHAQLAETSVDTRSSAAVLDDVYAIALHTKPRASALCTPIASDVSSSGRVFAIASCTIGSTCSERLGRFDHSRPALCARRSEF